MLIVGAMLADGRLIDDGIPHGHFLALVASGEAIAIEPLELAEPGVFWSVRDPERQADRRLGAIILRDLRRGRYIVRDGPESAALRAEWAIIPTSYLGSRK